MTEQQFSHLDAEGRAKMVDVGEKPISSRSAVARGEVALRPDVLQMILDGTLKKGNLLTTAQLAGIMAAKRTAELIPLCHPVPLDEVRVDLVVDLNAGKVLIEAEAKTTYRTGVEMEALTAVCTAALTVYDMIKAVQKDGIIQNIRLIRKTGGTHGEITNE